MPDFLTASFGAAQRGRLQ